MPLRLLRPSAAKWTQARTEAEVAQREFEAKHPEPYDSGQRAVAVGQRATQQLHQRGYRL